MAQTTAAYNQNKRCEYQKIANRKIGYATAGLYPFIYRNLTQNISPENLTIAEYILAMKTEINISDASRSNIIKNLSLFSRFGKNKSFIHMKREDVLKPSKMRKIPEVVENIPMLKRREQPIYRPTDLWTVEDDILFLKYCPHIR